ncbi:MAG: hypothetical protein L6R38_005866 [Xanthoria sp. 2 TBL-2021]|nr:MAG: hypothetical protein L6R38_005866 [Xanthoria sp. 2 TBL-2021]
MSRAFSTSAAKAVERWSGFSREKLSPQWKKAVEKFTMLGGSAEGKLGKIESVEIKTRDEGPVHKSLFNPKDKEDIISIRVQGENGIKTCHVYEDGSGTTKKGGDRA